MRLAALHSQAVSEIHPAERLVRRSRRAAEQFRTLCRVLSLISPLVPHTPEQAALQTLSKSLANGFNGLVLLDGPALEATLRKLETGVQQLGQALDALDARVPMSWFRARFDPSQASSVALADYASLLSRSVGEDPARLDRLELILTRLVRLFVSAEHDSPELRRQLLAEALPPSNLAAPARQAAVTFCHDAVQRLETFTRLGDLIGSRFFVDVRSFKHAQRLQLLDPEVMSAVIELNEATSEVLDRLARAEQVQGKALEQHLLEVDLRIKSLFLQLRVDEAEKTKQFEAWLTRSVGGPPMEPRRTAAPVPVKARGRHRLIIAVVALVLGLLLLFGWSLAT